MCSYYIRCAARSLVLVASVATGSGALIAQQNKDQGLTEITVTAPRLVTKRVVGRTPAGSEVELVSLTRRVSYADLNLALHTDVTQLETRIDAIAKQACEDLAKMYPLSDPKTPDCVHEAVRSAKPQLDTVVAAAGKH